MKKGRVFVLNAAGHDFSAAMQFTDEPLVILTEGNVPVFSSDRLHYSLSKRLAGFRTEDHLLLSGTPLLALLAALAIKEKTNLERINVLLWSASRRQYIRRVVSLRGTFSLARGNSGEGPQSPAGPTGPTGCPKGSTERSRKRDR